MPISPEIDFTVTEVVNIIDKQLTADWTHEREMRPYHGFIYLQKGRIRYRDARESLVIEGDELLYLKKGSSYSLTSVSSERPEYIIVNFQIDESENQGTAFANLLGRRIVPQDKLAMEERFRRLNDLYFYMPTGYRLELRAQLYNILCMALRASIMKNVTGNERRLLPAVQRIREIFDQPYDIAALAGLCGLSASHFRKLFRDHFGMSPRDYILALRIDRAKSLLVQSDLPISVIAERTGFGDDAYFCKMFRESTGATPRAFREKGGEIQ